MSGESRSDRRKDAWIVAAVALAVRVAVVVWALPRFPPTADGVFYQRLAERVGGGLGSTWAWPDGAVTYAAHYPIGYPGALGILYALLGPRPGVAMALNATLGALAAVAAHQLAARGAGRRAALIAGLLVALHPGLVGYTPAVMTEGVTAALTVCAAWATAWGRDRLDTTGRWIPGVVVVGSVIGLATLVRPQTLLLAPLFGAIAGLGGAPGERGGARSSVRATKAALVALGVALATCAPWTLRNCTRMGKCALVSVNGGWNLLIGADEAATGAWSPIRVPDPCREVWDEAAKDACFEREATRAIAASPGRWLGLVPKKLAATFDYCGAAGWYLNASNPSAFDERHKIALGVVETAYERAVLLLALVWAARFGARRASGEPTEVRVDRIRVGIALVGGVFLLLVHAWVSYVAFAVAAALAGRRLVRGSVLGACAVAAVAACAATHAVYFGSGRYSLVVFPLLSGVGGLAAAARRGAAFDKGLRTPASFGSEETSRCP